MCSSGIQHTCQHEQCYSVRPHQINVHYIWQKNCGILLSYLNSACCNASAIHFMTVTLLLTNPDACHFPTITKMWESGKH